MSALRIRIVQDVLRSGGTERQTVLLAQAFRAAGHDVGVITFRPGGVLAGTLAPVSATALQPFDLGLNWFAPGLVRTLRRECPDVVLLMGRMANSYGARLVAALPGTVVVGTMRTGKALPRGFRRSLSKVAHVVANSAESARVLMERYGMGPERVSVIHNALVFPPGGQVGTVGAGAGRTAEGEALRRAGGVGGGSVVLLCVGMFRVEKNQRALIEAAARVSATGVDWRLWFVGEGPERVGCTALAERLGLAERVKFFGFQADPRPFYEAADLAILASRAESLSNFLIEAQAHGLPVVAARAAGVDECIEDGVTGILVPADDTGALAAALTRYLVDPAARVAAARAAAKFARRVFAPAERARDYLALFTRLRG
ncbi:MAG: glycosyltransferase, partial [Verrucomicrobia bacterium]|nr:glycosyltransferase [Verrucomicrobiota bacterium]